MIPYSEKQKSPSFRIGRNIKTGCPPIPDAKPQPALASAAPSRPVFPPRPWLRAYHSEPRGGQAHLSTQGRSGDSGRSEKMGAET